MSARRRFPFIPHPMTQLSRRACRGVALTSANMQEAARSTAPTPYTLHTVSGPYLAERLCKTWYWTLDHTKFSMWVRMAAEIASFNTCGRLPKYRAIACTHLSDLCRHPTAPETTPANRTVVSHRADRQLGELSAVVCMPSCDRLLLGPLLW